MSNGMISIEMNDVVALKSGGDGEEEVCGVDSYTDDETRTISQQELDRDEEIGGQSDGEDTVKQKPSLCLALSRCICVILLVPGSIMVFLLFVSAFPNATVACWLVGAACLTSFLGTISFIIYDSIAKCRRDPKVLDVFVFFGCMFGYLVLLGVVFFGSVILNAAIANFAWSLSDVTSCWPTMVLLDLQVFFCIFAVQHGVVYMEMFEQREINVSSAAGIWNAACRLVAVFLVMFGFSGSAIGFAVLVTWVILLSPMPYVAWMAPIAIYAALHWLSSRLCKTSILEAAWYELASSPAKNKNGAFVDNETDADGTYTESTISSEDM